MKAARLHEFGQPLRIEELQKPEPLADEVLLQVDACGVCHSDLHIAHGDLPGFKAGTRLPLIPGHEVVGRVVQRGADVAHLQVGERVGVAWLHSACGQCEQCREGLENLCRKGVVTGMMVDGGYAQFMRAKASHALPIPEGLSSVDAAPLFCAGVTVYRALNNAHAGPGQRVAVFGVGGLGHLAVQIARAMGAEVIALDVSEEKLELARTLGASRAFERCGARKPEDDSRLGGAHVAVVTSAARAAYDTALKCLRPAGTLAVVGLPAEALSFAALALVSNEVHIVGSAVGTRDDMRAVLAMAAAGQIRCHTETQPLERVNEVFEQMAQGRISGRVVLSMH